MSDEVKIKLVLGIVLIVLCFFISMGCDEAQWNDGHCPNCGTAWTYEQAIGHRFSTGYMYVCKKCGRSIEVSISPNWQEGADYTYESTTVEDWYSEETIEEES